MLISVVFPEPDGPMSATHSAASTLKLRSSIARSDAVLLDEVLDRDLRSRYV